MAIYGQEQRQYLFDAINAENPGAITPVQFANATFGDPRVIPNAKADAPNTIITLRGRQGRGYIGIQTYRYRRLSLNDVFKNIIPVITSPKAYGDTFYESVRVAFVQNINARYGLNLEQQDVPRQYIYLNQKNTMNISPKCVQYVGGFTFSSVRGKNSLEEAVLSDVLSVMKHPIDLDPAKRCATILSFGHDFTDEPQVMQGMANGRMDVGVNASSGATTNLLNILAAHGLPSFNTTGATITRYKTTAESRANTRYDNVLVITNVNDPLVGGDWLLHYNN